MNRNNKIISTYNIKDRIFTIRGMQVMLDSDLANLYQVETKYLNRAVKRNIDRFPENFRFQLTEDEIIALESLFVSNADNNLRFQFGTSSKHGGRRYAPYAFTEQGVAMLSAVLRSETAVKVSIQIMQAFVEMKKFITNNAAIFQRLDKVELKQIETDKKVEQIFSALENKSIKPKQGIFYNGQIFDAYVFVAKLIKSANRSILLIDNYIDETVLTLFSKRKKNVSVKIYTKKISKQLVLDLKKYNQQYSFIEIKEFKEAHDRFLIIDDKNLYHFGASLKDLGKKWFAFSKFDKKTIEILNKLEE